MLGARVARWLDPGLRRERVFHASDGEAGWCGLMCFLVVNAALLSGQVFGRSFRVPITYAADEDHLES